MLHIYIFCQTSCGQDIKYIINLIFVFFLIYNTRGACAPGTESITPGDCNVVN